MTWSLEILLACISMELAVIGALAYLGSRSGRDGRQDRYLQEYCEVPQDARAFPPPENHPCDDFEDEHRRGYLAALNPKQSRVIPANVTPDQWPFYTSEAKQAGETDFGKARKLEMFSGETSEATMAITGTRPPPCKAGRAPLFGMQTNAHPVNSEGKTTTLYPAADERQRLHVSDKHNNVGPCEKVMVGPGLGLGPDVQAAGGFHQGYRILPTNRMNFERLNRETPGRVIPGGAPISKPGTCAPFSAQGRKRHADADMTARHLQPQQADYTAIVPRGTGTHCTRDKTFEAFFGGATGPQVQGVQGQSTRCKSDCSPSAPMINPISHFTSDAGYLLPQQQPESKSQRETAGGMLGPRGRDAPGHVTHNFCAPVTNRSNCRQPDSIFRGTPAVPAPPARSAWKAPETNRGKQTSYLGPATGPAAFVPGAQVTIRSMRQGVMNDRMPGPQSDNAFNPDVGAFRLRHETNASRPPVDERSQSHGYAEPGQSTKCQVRLSQINPWADPAIQESQRQQLQGNHLWRPGVEST